MIVKFFTIRAGKNRGSFSTATMLEIPVSNIDLVNRPGPKRSKIFKFVNTWKMKGLLLI